MAEALHEYPTLVAVQEYLLKTHDLDISSGMADLRAELIRVGVIAPKDWPEVE